MNRILVPCDGTAHALHGVRYAAQVAAGQSEVHLLYVIEPHYDSPAFLLSSDALDAHFPQEARQALEPAVALLEHAGVRHQVHCRSGHPAEGIAAQVGTGGYDAIVLGVRSRARIAAAVFGSVTGAVLQLAHVPLTLVTQPPHAQADAAPASNRILLACDHSDPAQRAAAYVAALVRARPELQVELLHVLDPMKLGTRQACAAGDLASGEHPVLLHELQAARRELDAAGVPYLLRCQLGDPASGIIAQADASQPGLIVMGTRAMGAQANLMVGSVSARVAQFVNTPLTLIK